VSHTERLDDARHLRVIPLRALRYVTTHDSSKHHNAAN